MLIYGGNNMRRTTLAGILAMLLTMVGLAFAAPAALAGSSVGSFEIDGNTVDSPVGEPIDWESPPPNLTTFTDATGSKDDSFNNGSKETEPGNWSCITGSAPGKDDITAGQIAFRTLAGKQYVYVDYTRKGVNGDAHIDYEFNQSSVANPACPALPKRTDGDIVLTFDTENGGATINVSAYRWSGGAVTGTFTPLALGSQGSTWDGAVNLPTNTIPGHIAGDFGEAALNLTDTIGAISCGQFATAYMKTRSSTSISAALQDRTSTKPIQVGDCPKSSLTKAVRNFTKSGSFATTASAVPGDTIEYQLTYKNTGAAPATDVTISDVIQAGQTYVAGSCTAVCSFPFPNTVSWHFDSVAVGATIVLKFQVTLDASFPNGTTTINNVGVFSNKEEGTKNSNTTTVTVTAQPKSSLTKAVRNVTTKGTFSTATDASPGDTIEYQLTYKNTGTGTATNVVVSDPIPTKTTYLSCTLGCATSGSPVSSVSWTFATVAPGDTKVMTFQVKLDQTGWTAGTSTPVTNTAKACTTEEGTACTTTPPVIVTVKTPSSSLAKKVRKLPSGTFATAITASPGDSVEYQLTYTNAGPGISHNVVISDPIPSRTTFVSCSDTCTQTGTPVTSVSWSLGDIASGGSKSVTFIVKLDSSFPAGTTTITNVATICNTEEGCKNSPPVTVTVTATPKLALVKSADKTGTVTLGDNITYTLAYSNTGNADATTVKITEPIPTGSMFVSCSNSCTTDGPPVTTATWNLGTVNAGTSGSVTLTVKVSDGGACQICNTAQITSPDQAAVNSNKVCISAQPTSDPSTAVAKGDAYGLKAYVPLLGLGLVDTDVISPSSSTQTGLGQTGKSNEVLTLDILGVVGLTSVAKADVLRTTSSSEVTKATGARQTSTAEVLGLNVLNGLVTANVVRAVASTTADGTSSSYSANGTTATNLKVAGNSVTNIAPGTRIPLDATLWGTNSYVAINEQTGSTSGPTGGQLSGGTYKADLTVAMIRVVVTGGVTGTLLVGTGPPLEITVAKATAHSEHKQTTLCTSSPTTAVSGHAFIASSQVSPLVPTATVGFVEIPASGGSAHMGVAAALLPADGSIVSSGTAASDTTGTAGATSSTSSSYADVQNVCVLKSATTCLVKADLIRSQANSSATSSARSSNANGTNLVNVQVTGQPLIAQTPPPNTVIPLLGIGSLVLNEQIADGTETGHTGLTVRGLHLKLFVPLAPLLTGAEVIVAEAHSDATFR